MSSLSRMLFANRTSVEEEHPKKEAQYVWVEYTAQDGLGKAKIGYRYPLGQAIPLTNGEVVPVEGLRPGMRFSLERGTPATVTRADPPSTWPPPSLDHDRFGNAPRGVIGTFQFTGWVQLLEVRYGGAVHRVGPEHLFWSESRRGWYPIGSFVVGELLRAREQRLVPVESITPPRWVQETVYNYEVDEYHTYFVGNGEAAVWSHNGMGQVGCSVPKAARAESGKLASGSTVGLGGDRKFAVGWDAIFGPKNAHAPSGALAGKKVGHTFSKHGSHNTHELAMEAKNSRRPVGQWTDDAAAEAFIGSKLPELRQGAKTFDLPPGLGRQINPDGSFTPANKVRLVPSKSGVKTAFPFFGG